jgi:hypothetical protein
MGEKEFVVGMGIYNKIIGTENVINTIEVFK